MARDLGPRHREPHVGEQSPRLALARCAAPSRRYGSARRRRRRRARAPRPARSARRRSCEDSASCAPFAFTRTEGPRSSATRRSPIRSPVLERCWSSSERRAQPSGRLGTQGSPVRSEAAHPGSGRSRRRRCARRRCRRISPSAIAWSSTRASSTTAVSPSSASTPTGRTASSKAIPCRTARIRSHDSLSFEEAAAFPLVFETAYRMLVTKAALREGEWVLIWGIGGGVALAAFELCRALGARTIVTSSSPEKLERARRAGRRRRASSHVRRRRRRRPFRTRPVAGSGRRRRDGRRGDLGALARRSRAGGADRRLRRDVRPQPTGAPLPALVEAARRLRLDDGHALGLRRCIRAHSRRAERASTSTACSRSPTPRRPTSASSRASSSGRSSLADPAARAGSLSRSRG